MKKHLKLLSAIALASIIVTACGTSEVNKVGSGNEEPKLETPSEKESVVNEEMISSKIDFSDGYYTFTLKNITNEPITLSFSSTQSYEYQLKDQNGQVVYTYSMDKMFGQMFVEKTLAANEEFTMNVDVDPFTNLQPGTYNLEIWSVAQNANLSKVTTQITLDEVGNSLEGSYVGQIDSNSVELIDANGNETAFRLTSNAKEMIGQLQENDKVVYSYFKKDGQLFLTMIHSVQ